MSAIHIAFTCPYCGLQSRTLIDNDEIPHTSAMTTDAWAARSCDPDEGGCEKTVILHITAPRFEVIAGRFNPYMPARPRTTEKGEF